MHISTRRAAPGLLIAALLTTALLIAALPSAATAGSPRGGRAPVLVALTQCRTLPETAARLACFDRSVAALEQAEANRTIVIIDQQQVRETRRAVFGIALPETGLLGKAEDLPQIEAVLAGASVDDSGHWRFQLADGARWVQTDDNVIARRPRAKDAVVIKRAALGSFRMSVGGQPAVKVRRLN